VRFVWTLVLLMACDRVPTGLRGEPQAPAVVESCDPVPDAPGEGGIALSKPALPPGAHFVVLPGVTLSSPVAARLTQLDDEFSRRTKGHHLTVVSGTRDPARQARAMYQVLRHGGNLRTLYEDRDAALEIQQAHDRAEAAGKPPSEVIAAMQAVLQGQVDHGVYISAHLRAGAVDIRNTSMSASERRAFRSLAQDAAGVRLLEEQHPPHFHLQID
jgi:hypothetical protein